MSSSISGWFVQQHRELELLASFRERFGCDWLQYRSHLETMGSPPLSTTKTPALSTPPLDVQSLETACNPPAIGDDTKESAEKESEEGRVEPEPQEEEREEQDKEEGSREDLEEEQEQEQKAVEGERPATIGLWGHGYRDVRDCREASLGRTLPPRGPGPFVHSSSLSVSLQQSYVAPCWCVPCRELGVCKARSAFSGSLLPTCLKWNSKQLGLWSGWSYRAW